MKVKTKIGQLRVYWISNPPTKVPFKRLVKNVVEAIYIINLLTDYDLHLGDLIFANASGLEVYEQEFGWTEYYNEEGMDIKEIIKG